MCGITGAVARTEKGRVAAGRIDRAVECLVRRGPDAGGTARHGNVTLGHRRLSVIDTSDAAAQPMHDATGRYSIVFNGEFFNFREHRSRLADGGYPFRTASDTEVLLALFARDGSDCLRHVNGFFALAIYDRASEELFIARDRFGVKPLLLYESEDVLAFGSEMKSILAYGIPRKLDTVSLYTYLQLNYVPGPATMLQGIRKMEPGTFIVFSVKENRILREEPYYRIPLADPEAPAPGLREAAGILYDTMDRAVQRRLVSDVPLGAFLSGGIDSSVVAALAARHSDRLETFSIGFTDEPYYDETRYAQAVANHLGTDHTVFSVTNDDLFGILHDVLDYIDEPFADSSALNVFLLSRQTRRRVTVALSGDGGDELFAGYNKHRAEWILRNNALLRLALKGAFPLLAPLRGSRRSAFGNRIRQLGRLGEGARLGARERYWRWCCIAGERAAADLMLHPPDLLPFGERKGWWLRDFGTGGDFNRLLLTDVNLILPGDMLTKVDLMSMANSLEVRTPFLDYEVVNAAFALPATCKIDRHSQKVVLKEAFASLLPAGITGRRKQGFEVPLRTWFRTSLRSLIEDDLLADSFIAEQGLFERKAVARLRSSIDAANPGEGEARIWGLVVFQYWWKKYLGAR